MKNINYLLSLFLLIFLPSCVFYRNAEMPLKGIKHMTLEEAIKARDYYRKTHDNELLIKTLERIIALSTDHALTDQALFELANVQLLDAKYETAQKLYREYNMLYPGSEQRRTAWYNEILAHYRDIATPDRDQSKTKETLALTKKFLDEFDEGEFTAEVETIQRACYKQLLKHELIVTKFYLKRFDYDELPSFVEAARNRVVYMANELLKPLEIEIPDFARLRSLILQLPSIAAGSEKAFADRLYSFVYEIEQKLTAPQTGKKCLYRRIRDRF